MLRKALVIAASAGLVLGALSAPAFAATEGKHPEPLDWSFNGPFGKFDQAELQRGYKVYHEVCAQCHSMNLMSFRNLGEKGGPFFDPKYEDPNKNPYVKALAADVHADLLVMGCYGHSRFRELVLGGASRSILQHMTVPVLMSH